MASKLALSAFAAVGLAAAAGVARANAIDQTATYNFANLNQTGTLTFNGFDAKQGTLTGVSFYFTNNATLNDPVLILPAITENLGSPQKLAATATVQTTSLFSSSASTTMATPGFAGSMTGPVLPAIVGTASALLTSNTVTASNLTPFFGGTDSVVVDLFSTASQGGSVPTNSSTYTGNSGFADVIGFLEYTFIATPGGLSIDIPEPASLVLLGTALAGIGVAARFRG